MTEKSTEKRPVKSRNNIYILESLGTVSEDDTGRFEVVAGSFKSTAIAKKHMQDNFNTAEYHGRIFVIAAMTNQITIKIEQKNVVTLG